MTNKKTDDTGDILNTTLTDLEILKNLEKAFYKNNPQQMKRNTAASMDWFRNYIPRAYNKVRTSQMMRDRSMWKQKIVPGRMYFFEYDAINKDTLPVWDRFPLIFPWDLFTSKAGDKLMLGINLHYLKPQHRMIAMQELMKLKTEKRYRKSTKLKLSWELLKGLSSSKYYEHAIKMYRIDHVKTVFMEIPSASWEMVAFLPLARWKNGTKSLAWNLQKKKGSK